MFGSQAGARRDERDQLIKLRGQQFSGYLLAVGMFSGILLSMLLQVHPFWIAQALIGAWVVAEIGGGVTKLVLYRVERMGNGGESSAGGSVVATTAVPRLGP